MARIRQKAAEYAAKDFATEIRMAGVRMGLNSATAIADAAGMDRDTVRRRMRNPSTFKLGEILNLMEALHMGPDSLKPLARGGKVS